MNRHLLTIALFFLITAGAALAQEEKKVSPPKQISLDGKTFKYNPAWQDKETYLEVNCDEDPDKEIIISFLATYRPPSKESRENKRETFLPPERELALLENYAFYQIYDKDPGGYYQPVKTIHAMDQLGEVKISRLENTTTNALAFLSPGGEHYTDLAIYQWQDEGYRLLFNDGGSQGVELDTDSLPVTIRIPRDEGADIFTWDAASKSFVRSGCGE